MAQITQQDHLYMAVANIQSLTDTEKTSIRRAYVRGVLLDVVIVAQGMNIKVVTTFKDSIGKINITLVLPNALKTIDCGALQPSDYSDDTPSPDIQ